MPDKLNIENEVKFAVRAAIHKAVAERLGGYQSPLNPIVDHVVSENKAMFHNMILSAIDSMFENDHRKELRDAIAHKISKCLVSKMEGEIEKRVNDIRSNPEMRAKITLAITNVIKEVGELKA